jgi:aminoglycoside/choline kinase family phosphotransferase
MGDDGYRLSGPAESFLDTWANGRKCRIEPMTGDASNRRYFRILLEGDNSGTGGSVVLMERRAPEGFKASEEKTSSFEAKSPGDPFLVIGRFLKDRRLPVPEVYSENEDGSLLILEDLGRETLADALARTPSEEPALRKAAIDLLLSLQGQDPKPEGAWLSDRPFSTELYAWEFEHFIEFGSRRDAGTDHERARVLFETESVTLAKELPMVLLHRDFHSRNLMRDPKGRLVMIDFQDMRVGSPLYDLASFLFDAYRPVPVPLLDELVEGYYERARKAGILPKTLTSVRYRNLLARHAFQRNLKACGRFYYIDVVKKNPAYLDSVPQTHRNMEFLAGWEPSSAPLWDAVRPLLKDPGRK